MADTYFKNEHFELLREWKGKVYDKDDPDQQRVYEELRQAYDVTKRWAESLKQQMFEEGWTRTIRKPIDQWQKKFIHYNWARIYPTQNAPEGLAYTVGIDDELGFIVKIDLVDIKVNDSALRRKYEEIRGPVTNSPIVAIKPPEDGLALDLPGLVAWSIHAINDFKLRYDDVARQLNLSPRQDQEGFLHHFVGHEDFNARQPLWGATTTELFGRFVRAVNELGLDWWFTRTTNSQLRFGRKEKGAAKSNPIGRLFLRMDGVQVSWPDLDWAKLILQALSPISGIGKHHAPSLLFPMEAVFEAYVKKHLAKQLRVDFVLQAQANSQHLIVHDGERWFRMKPDLIVRRAQTTRLVLDTKWKLLDSAKRNAREKYQLSQADFYQLYAYGHHYLDGKGDLALIYPKIADFPGPLPVFDFPKATGMRLWVLPFCLETRRLMLPDSPELQAVFKSGISGRT